MDKEKVQTTMRKQCGKVIEWLWVQVPSGQPYTLLVQWIE